MREPFMVQRELLVREMREWLLPLDFAKPRTFNPERLAPETLSAMRAILVEIEEASVYSAITASIAGALTDSRTKTLTLQHLVTYLPPSPEIYRQHINTLLKAELSARVLLPMQAYHARICYALRLTRAVVDAGPAPSTVVRNSEMEKLDDAWRHVCGTALAAVGAIRETMQQVRFARPAPVNENAEALLRSAKAGGRPCIGEDGQVAMPRWAESRAHARHVTHIVARLGIHGGSQPVTVENASRMGLGLKGLSEAFARERVTVTFPDGEVLSGTIMWARGERGGLQLDRMLMPDHPLLTGRMARP